MDTIIHLKNYTTTLRKSDAYFDEKEQAFDLYLAQLKDLSKYLKKVSYNAEFVAGFLYKLYDFDHLTFEQMGQFVDLLKSKYSSKSGDTDLDQILEDYIESVSKPEDSYDDMADRLSIPGLD